MPKVVDHEERKRELAEAVWRVILRDGVEGVSVRNVATEAGWSTGALRHYFGTKEELLGAAAALMEERTRRRLESKYHGGTPREAVRSVLCETLPLDEERRAEGSLWFAFAARSLVDPRTAEEHHRLFNGMRELCHRVVHSMDEGGWLVSSLGPRVETARLHALLDGLFMQMFIGGLGEEELLEVLDAHLEEIIRDP